jgi:hypothetical protein
VTAPTFTLHKYKLAQKIMALVEAQAGTLIGTTQTVAWAAIHDMLDSAHAGLTTEQDKASAICGIIKISRVIRSGKKVNFK